MSIFPQRASNTFRKKIFVACLVQLRAEIQQFGTHVDGMKGAALKEIFPEAPGIAALVDLGVLHRRRSQVPGAVQKGLDHRGNGGVARQAVKGLEAGPEAHPQPQVGPVSA